MDEIVRRAMQKWPNVPAVFGWLGLDMRGNWLIKGERVTNHLLNEFIARNYDCDKMGRWFFQNGPQRVFVTLTYTPWIFRYDDASLTTHTGRSARHLKGAWMDEEGNCIVSTELGAGLLDDRDAERVCMRFTDARGNPLSDDSLVEALDQLMVGQASRLQLNFAGQSVAVLPMRRTHVPTHLNFVADPQPLANEAKPNAAVG